MSVRAYVLIQTEVGKSTQVAHTVADIEGVVASEASWAPTTSSPGPRRSRTTP